MFTDTPEYGFVDAINHGQWCVALIFADWIEERGYAREARLLRSRHRKWEAARADIERQQEEIKAGRMDWVEDLRKSLVALGAKAAVNIEVKMDTKRVDHLYFVYIFRLAQRLQRLARS